jgi:hypothetical protein
MCPLLVFGPGVLMSVLGIGAFLGPCCAQIFLSSESMWRLTWTSTGDVDWGKFSLLEPLRYNVVRPSGPQESSRHVGLNHGPSSMLMIL